MKFAYFLIALVVFFPSAPGFAQWQSDTRLTFADGGSLTGGHNGQSIVAVHDTIYIVWYDSRDGNYEIYFKRSLDGGTTWGSDLRLTDDGFDSDGPTIVVDALDHRILHVAYYLYPVFEIYYKRSTDAGLTWSSDLQLTNDPEISWMPSLAQTNANLHLVWRESRDGSYDVFYKRSSDQGLTWGPDTNLNQTMGSSETPCITAGGSMLHVLWFDNRDGGAYEIYYKRSTDQGLTWGPDTRLTNDPGVSFGPDAVVRDSMIHVIWQDTRQGPPWELYYKRSTNYGVTWGPDTRLTYADSTLEEPSVAVSQLNVHVVWYEKISGNYNYEIYYKKSTDQGTTWGPDTRLTNDTSWSYHAHLAMADSMLHVIWVDGRAGGTNDEIFYKRNPTGNPVAENAGPPFADGRISVVPTMFRNAFTVTAAGRGSAAAEIAIFDVSGRRLFGETMDAGKTSRYFAGERIAGLKPGVYFITVGSGSGLVGRIKTVKVE